MEQCSWYILPAGNITTTQTMMDAIRLMVKQKASMLCIVFKSVTLKRPDAYPVSEPAVFISIDRSNLNIPSFGLAMQNDLTLYHGSPGTGKTTTIVRILDHWRKVPEDTETILVAVSTNNAVDNVLEKYL